MTADVFEIVFPLWIKSYIITLIMEIPLFVIVAKWGNSKPVAPLWRLILAGAVGTCFTHPLFWFVWSRLITDYALYIGSGELIIAVIESFTFYLVARPISFKRAVAASFIANAVSYVGGILISI